jgi:hypothetical protein
VLTVGAYAGVAGLSLGFGVALDRDAVSDPVLPYLRIGASSDLWPMLKGVAPSGPTTASAASAQSQLR